MRGERRRAGAPCIREAHAGRRPSKPPGASTLRRQWSGAGLRQDEFYPWSEREARLWVVPLGSGAISGGGVLVLIYCAVCPSVCRSGLGYGESLGVLRSRSAREENRASHPRAGVRARRRGRSGSVNGPGLMISTPSPAPEHGYARDVGREDRRGNRHFGGRAAQSLKSGEEGADVCAGHTNTGTGAEGSSTSVISVRNVTRVALDAHRRSL